jgi:hypothetical protein
MTELKGFRAFEFGQFDVVWHLEIGEWDFK